LASAFLSWLFLSYSLSFFLINLRSYLLCRFLSDAQEGGLITTRVGFFYKPDASASAIADPYKTGFAHTYDIFAQVCGVGTYLPNKRLQRLVDGAYWIEQADIIKFRSLLMPKLLCVDTFRNVIEGSETKVTKHNIEKIFSVMKLFCGNELELDTQKSWPDEMIHLARSATAEACLTISLPGMQFQVAAGSSEVKRIEASIRTCYPQLVTICGSSSIELHRLGLSRDDSVVLGIALAGASCQFCATYLIANNFPVFVTLSPELGLFDTFEDQNLIAKWCLTFVAFCIETKRKLIGQRSISSIGPFRGVQLNLRESFVKPVRRSWKQTLVPTATAAFKEIGLYSTRNIRLNYIMRVYEKLRHRSITGGSVETGAAQSIVGHIEEPNCILFPLGVISVPGDKDANKNAVTYNKELRDLIISECYNNGFGNEDLDYSPLIMFPRLSKEKGWSNDKPPERLHAAYLDQLRIACDLLNVRGVAHLDLRPANIMWRESSVEEHGVEMFLIDFEDAVIFGDIIPLEFIQFVVETKDGRYPFTVSDLDHELVAQVYHNEFFYHAISKWIQQTDNIPFTYVMSIAMHEEIILACTESVVVAKPPNEA
jgi:hypothetical protein